MPGLHEPLKTQVRGAFAASLDVLWEVMIAVSGLGFLSALLMREMPLQNVLDDTWGLKGEAEKTGEVEGEGEGEGPA